jgi:hypothetical protein
MAETFVFSIAFRLVIATLHGTLFAVLVIAGTYLCSDVNAVITAIRILK